MVLNEIKFKIVWGVQNCNDPIVLQNVALLLERSIVWEKKYWVTLARDDLSEKQWLQHAIEEGADMINYLQKLLFLQNTWKQ